MNDKLKVIHQMWILQIITTRQVILYLEYLDTELVSLTLGGIAAQSKDKKTKYIYGE